MTRLQDKNGTWDVNQTRTQNLANEIATISGVSTNVAYDAPTAAAEFGFGVTASAGATEIGSATSLGFGLQKAFGY